MCKRASSENSEDGDKLIIIENGINTVQSLLDKLHTSMDLLRGRSFNCRAGLEKRSGRKVALTKVFVQFNYGVKLVDR
jgi:hypothetical protein